MKKSGIQLYILLLFLLTITPFTSIAQVVEHSTEESDFQANVGFSLDKKIVKGLHLTWSEELRMKNSVTQVNRIYSVIAVSYELFSWFKVGADYNFIAVKTQPGWEFRNRSNLDALLSIKANRWKFSLRERFRVTSANREINPLTEVNPSWIMRSRLMAEYNPVCSPLRPYVYFELSNTLNAPLPIHNYVDKIRASVGVKYAVSPHSEFDLFYRFDHNRDKAIARPSQGMPWIVTTEKKNNHILGLFYEYSF